MEKMVVGLSGGVDSAVAAWLLKQQGYEVIGLFMVNWKDNTGRLAGDCDWEEEQIMAELVAKKLDIPLHVVDLTAQYKAQVAGYLFGEYGSGRIPNPDVMCNHFIKFDAYRDLADKLGASLIATGHYCRIKNTIKEDGVQAHLLAGVDPDKDQSYFLCRLTQEQLNGVLFPLGDYTKAQVRRIAREIHLPSADKKDSQGICFIGKVDLPVFLGQSLIPQQGDVVEIDPEMAVSRRNAFEAFSFSPSDGKRIGEHQGAFFYTTGQRKGLDIGGSSKPRYVLSTDIDNNVVYVGQGDDHPGLYRTGLMVRRQDVHWLGGQDIMSEGDQYRYDVRIRYRQPLQKATLKMGQDALYVSFEEPQRAISSGQFIAWYQGDELIGSGVIK